MVAKMVDLPDKLITEAITEFCKLKPYPATPAEIVEMARTVERVVDGLDALALCWLVDEMLAGRYEYDRYAGIQQLTSALQRIEKTKTGYQFKTDFPG